MRNLREVWAGVFSEQWYDDLIVRVASYPTSPAKIGFAGHGEREDRAHRISDLRWLDPHGGDAEISNAIMRLVRSSNRSNLGFDLAGAHEIQFTEYRADQGGHHDWHHDV